jgi:DNA-binding winged helix-turn-helix (wHTH) protein
VTPPVRYRFDAFALSPRQRLLLRDGCPVPLIPKYFDLLVLLVRHRHEAVSKQQIFGEIWSDVVVSDGALSQAVRTLRRTLNDNSREPRFIRTVSRHGYQFVWSEVVEEPDDDRVVTVTVGSGVARRGGYANGNPSLSAADAGSDSERDSLERLVDRLFLALAAGADGLDDARETAERLHTLDTPATISLIKRRPNHAGAVAVMRDARWTIANAGAVPLDTASALALIRLRAADARRTMARRWAGAAVAGALAGVIAGLVGGLALSIAGSAHAMAQAALGLAAIGAVAGGVGAGGVGAGLAAAEVLARSRRGAALAASGAIAGALVAFAAHAVVRAVLAGLVGATDIAIPGFLEGLVVGGAVGTGYAVATPQPPGGGVAAPAGRRRIVVAAITGLATAAAGVVLALADRTLVGGLINEIARSSPNAQLVLAPLGQLIGEPDFGRATRVIISALECGAFGAAVASGLTIRPAPSSVEGPKSRTSH